MVLWFVCVCVCLSLCNGSLFGLCPCICKEVPGRRMTRPHFFISWASVLIVLCGVGLKLVIVTPAWSPTTPTPVNKVLREFQVFMEYYYWGGGGEGER